MSELEILANKIKEEGYEIVFGITGSGQSYSLIKYLTDLGLKYVTVSNEAVAAIAAGTYNYYNKKKALSITIKGPGFANVLAGITACYFERFEMLNISEAYASNSSLEAMHKRLDQLEMIKPIIKNVSSLSYINELESFLKDDYLNPFPKHFELANVTTLPIEERKLELECNPNLIKEIIEKIAKTKQPILIVGSLLYRLNINLDHLQLPILTTLQAKGIINELNENACGIYTGVGEELVIENEILQQADCVVTIGLKNQEILGVASKKNFINLDIAYNVEFENTHYCSINQLKEIIASLNCHTNWANLIIQKYKVILNNYVASYEWMPGNIFDSINKIKSNITVVLDTGFFCTVGEHVYLANSSSKRIVCSSNGRNMGLSVPMTLGIAINNNPTICCFGDGGIRYHIGDIRTIIELNLPVCFILFSDGIYGSVASYVGADILNEELTKPAGIDWAPMFTSFNILSKVVENTFDFETVLFQWDMKSPIFIEAKFDKKIYREMTKKLRK